MTGKDRGQLLSKGRLADLGVGPQGNQAQPGLAASLIESGAGRIANQRICTALT